MRITSTLAIVALAATLTTTEKVEAGHFRDAEKTAFQLKIHTAEICQEIRLHFNTCGQFRELYRAAYEAYCLADKLHCAIHDGEDLRFVGKAADELEERFDCMEDLVKKIKRYSPSRSARFEIHSRQHISDFHLKRLCKLIDCAEEDADDLEDQVEDLIDDARRRPVGFVPPLHPDKLPVHRPVIPRRPVGHRHYNVDFGRGFSFSIVVNK